MAAQSTAHARAPTTNESSSFGRYSGKFGQIRVKFGSNSGPRRKFGPANSGLLGRVETPPILALQASTTVPSSWLKLRVLGRALAVIPVHGSRRRPSVGSLDLALLLIPQMLRIAVALFTSLRFLAL